MINVEKDLTCGLLDLLGCLRIRSLSVQETSSQDVSQKCVKIISTFWDRPHLTSHNDINNDCVFGGGELENVTLSKVDYRLFRWNICGDFFISHSHQGKWERGVRRWEANVGELAVCYVHTMSVWLIVRNFFSRNWWWGESETLNKCDILCWRSPIPNL